MARAASSRAGQTISTLVITTARLLRACANGASSLIIARWLSALRYTDAEVTYFLIVLLLGKAIRILVLNSIAPRKFVVAAVFDSLFMVAVGTVFGALMDGWVLWTAGMVGVIDVGILCLPASGRNVYRTEGRNDERDSQSPGLRSSLLDVELLGRVAGALGCGLVMQYLMSGGSRQFTSYCIVWWLFAATGIINATLYMVLGVIPHTTLQNGDSVDDEAEWGLNEFDHTVSPLRSPHTSNPHLEHGQITAPTSFVRLGFLFLDSVAGGMLTISLVALFVEKRHSLRDYQLGILAASLLLVNAVAQLYAPRLLILLPSFRGQMRRSGDQIGTFFSKAGSGSSLRRLRQDDEAVPVSKIIGLVGQCIGLLMTGALAGTSHFGIACTAGIMLKMSGWILRAYIDMSR